MKLCFLFIILLSIGILLNIFNYSYFLIYLAIMWAFTSILIIYVSIRYSYKLRFIQINIREIYKSIKSKSKNNVKPISSLFITLAAKIGVGSLSGIALCIYYGGLGSIFWFLVISILISVNTYIETVLGIRYRDSSYQGGPSYYIRSRLNNKYLSYLYSILIIITYSVLFLSIQSNTIIISLSSYKIDNIYIISILSISIFIIIIRGLSSIKGVNNIIVPIMLLVYLLLGVYIFINNINLMGDIFKLMIREAFHIRSIIPIFIIGMQKAIFITESSIGTSAISAATCDNNPHNQGLLEVLGIYIVVFVICITTVIIISTSDYKDIIFNNISGIDIVMYAFKYHFGNMGSIILTIISSLFAFSTIISSYFFGENNLKILTSNKGVIYIFKIIFIIIIIVSSYIDISRLWNLCDYFISLLVIINLYSIIKILKRDKI